MDWKEKAVKTLEASLYPVPVELNELDWKSSVSPKTERLAQHICAMANYKGGGMLVFGVNDDGSCFSMEKQEIDKTVKLLGNIAKNNLSYAIQIEHQTFDYKGYNLLFVYIPEQHDKPVYMRGKDIFDSYCRSAGQTVKMSVNQVKDMIALSEGISFEQRQAVSGCSGRDVLQMLNYRRFYELIDKDVPKAETSILNRLADYGLCQASENGWNITNLGAILFANRMDDFEQLKSRRVIVRKYRGTNNRDIEFQQEGVYGYIVGFDGLLDFVMKNTSVERIEGRREMIPAYPRVAIREFLANALVHQDFAIKGVPLTIEIYSNRLTITNPGPPLNDVNRLIDLPPNSRNERLAQIMFEFGICERRGSGVDRAVEAIEKMLLPAVRITKGEHFTKVTLFPRKEVGEMTKKERIEACYQHACLMYEDDKPINNQSVRGRFGYEKNKSSAASKIISETMDAGYIKPEDPEMESKKFATYVPYYA